MQRILFNFYLAIEGVMANQLRAILTALGIIFGVGAVIAMLAIGTGAKQSILNQMKLIGTNNIVIKSVLPSDNGQEEASAASTQQGQGKDQKPWSPGLTVQDVAAIKELIPTIEVASPEIILPLNIVRKGKHQKGRCIGVTNAFFELANLSISKGKLFHPIQFEEGKPVCIIGKNIEKRFFLDGKAIGKKIKCGNVWLTIVGILDKRIATKESLSNLGIRDYNADIYVPISTVLLRFKNRALVNKKDIKSRRNNTVDPNANYHQLDRVVLRVNDHKRLQATADIAARMLKRRHKDLIDFEIEIPELLLQQQQKTQDTFNFVLGVIAGISLLVGGIGIMNIMLASVLERIKEIGVRRSLGANQQDIVFQFLFEAMFISLIGGVLGILLGVVSAKAIASYADIPTIVSTWSILLSFFVAASVGLVFGLFPAQKAAQQDPIKALRSD